MKHTTFYGRRIIALVPTYLDASFNWFFSNYQELKTKNKNNFKKDAQTIAKNS